MKTLIKNGRNLAKVFGCFSIRFLFLVSCLLIFSLCNFSQSSELRLKHPSGKFVQINGKKIWYESEGKGAALILITGDPISHAYFHPFFFALSDSSRIIYFDAFRHR